MQKMPLYSSWEFCKDILWLKERINSISNLWLVSKCIPLAFQDDLVGFHQWPGESEQRHYSIDCIAFSRRLNSVFARQQLQLYLRMWVYHFDMPPSSPTRLCTRWSYLASKSDVLIVHLEYLVRWASSSYTFRNRCRWNFPRFSLRPKDFIEEAWRIKLN